MIKEYRHKNWVQPNILYRIRAGLDIDIRLEIIKLIFSLSQSTTVHVKDLASGAEGLIPFVKAVLKGF